MLYYERWYSSVICGIMQTLGRSIKMSLYFVYLQWNNSVGNSSGWIMRIHNYLLILIMQHRKDLLDIPVVPVFNGGHVFDGCLKKNVYLHIQINRH